MRNKIFMIISFLAVVFTVSSCLKDNIGEDWTSDLKGKMYAEFPNNGAQVSVIQPVATDQIFKFLINIATDAVPTSDITLTLAFDAPAMAAYNADMQAADTSIHWSYELYPTMTIMEPTVTIAAGTRNTYVHVKLSNANAYSLTKKFMAPITIQDASGGVIVAANKKTVLYKLPIANKWEGTYKMKGWIVRDPYPDYTGWYKGRTMKLATNGPNSVQMMTGLVWAGSAGSTSGVGGIGKWIITISEGAVPNPITLVDPDNATVKLHSTYPNRYDPAVRTFYMDVYWGGGVGNRQTIDTLVYSGPY
jgi:Domain of unknown function (DUF1735)